MLSRLNITFAFGFVETNLCEVPTPTVVISKASGSFNKDFWAVSDNLILSSLILITYENSGKRVVVPIPTNPSVSAIPTAP